MSGEVALPEGESDAWRAESLDGRPRAQRGAARQRPLARLRAAGGRRHRVRVAAMKALLALFGAVQVVLGLLLWITPGFFFDEIGPYGVRNDHYLGDLATWYLALGAVDAGGGASRGWRIPVLVLALAQNTLHAFNHLIDVDHAHPKWLGPANLVSLVLTSCCWPGCSTPSASRPASRTAPPPPRRTPRPRTPARCPSPRRAFSCVRWPSAPSTRPVPTRMNEAVSSECRSSGPESSSPGRSTARRKCEPRKEAKVSFGRMSDEFQTIEEARDGPRRRRLPRRRVDRARVVPRRPARQAGAGRGPGRASARPSWPRPSRAPPAAS